MSQYHDEACHYADLDDTRRRPVSEKAYFVRYKMRTWSHVAEMSPTGKVTTRNTVGDWVEHTTCLIGEHPVDWIRSLEAEYGERAWVDRGAPFGHPAKQTNSHVDYHLLTFAEVPLDVAQRAVAADWGL